MLCTSCGKGIPYIGTVCPYCHRDKSRDQTIRFLGIVCAAVFGALGGWIAGVAAAFWGAIGGLFLGSLAATFMFPVAGPPVVQTAKPLQIDQAVLNIAIRLSELKRLRAEGLLTEADYFAKKAEVLAQF